jgi:hypothetical protein
MKKYTRLALRPLSAVNSIAFLAVAVLVAAACSESTLPTESKLGTQPHVASVLLGGCPNPFTAIDMLDVDGQAADRNGDGVACSLTENGMIVTWVDNNVPLTQIGGCPNGFTFIYAKSMDPKYADVDRNGDGFACSRITGSGATIIIDNNNSAPAKM